MWLQFYLENAHFSLTLLVSLVFFAVFWLYFDAWLQKRSMCGAFRAGGFLLLSISFLIHASYLEIPYISLPFMGDFNQYFTSFTKISGYFLIIFGEIIDPLQKKPSSRGLKEDLVLMVPRASFLVVSFFYPIAAVIAGFMYLRRSTVGLENHLKPVAFAFFVFSIYELISLSSLFRYSENVDIYNLVAPFSYLWFFEHFVLLTGAMILGRWVFGYLLKRIQTQLFMFFTFAVVTVFLLTTVTFTGLLLKSLETEALKSLETDVKVLSFAIDSKKGETLSDAQVLSQSIEVAEAVEKRDRPKLASISESILLTKRQSFLVITDENGQVLARGEDKERVGDNILSDDPVIKRALGGWAVCSAIVKEGVISPEISIRCATPVKSGGEIIGSVMTGTIIDNAFVDGIKTATGLEASIYGGNVLSATTLLGNDDKTRANGIKIENQEVKKSVLEKGKNYTGSILILNTPYFGAFLPLNDLDNTLVGMLFAGRPQTGVLQAAGRSIEFTFVVSAILMVVSIIPAFLISRYLANQLS